VKRKINLPLPFIIITSRLFFQKAWKLSFREVEDLAKAISGEESIPDYSTGNGAHIPHSHS